MHHPYKSYLPHKIATAPHNTCTFSELIHVTSHTTMFSELRHLPYQWHFIIRLTVFPHELLSLARDVSDHSCMRLNNIKQSHEHDNERLTWLGAWARWSQGLYHVKQQGTRASTLPVHTDGWWQHICQHWPDEIACTLKQCETTVHADGSWHHSKYTGVFYPHVT